MKKAFYVRAGFTYPDGKPGGIDQIPPDKIGEACHTIAGWGCDSVVIGYIDPRPLTDHEEDFREACDAAGMLLIPSCALHGSVAPTLDEVYSREWYADRVEEWLDWLHHWPTDDDGPWMLDCEFYRQHPYAATRNSEREDGHVRALRGLLDTDLIEDYSPIVWPFGGQNPNRLGSAFEVLGTELVATDEEYGPQAFKANPDGSMSDMPAWPPPNIYPSWFDETKIEYQRRKVTKGGIYIKPAPTSTVWRQSWSVSDVADGILESDDDKLMVMLGL